MQHFSRARVLLPGCHNGNQTQDAGLIGHKSQRWQHANMYVHAHGHVCATQHARTCGLCLCMPCMPDGLEAGRACPGQPTHASRCMPALGMVSLDTVGRVWGAGRAGGGCDTRNPIPTSPCICAVKACLGWPVEAEVLT